ncbi:MAG TPA: molybdenum cofactor biosynthesis protein MoaE [Gemmatimonadales bacterium]|nr:molybdenum cofactor biosynthesis protein MoaE [Gemmatimonadales bacterium]
MSPWLTDQPIDVGQLLADVASAGAGGTVAFLGTVRRSVEDGDVEAIEYSAYDAMAEDELGRIVAEARERWPGVRIALRHRVGLVALGEASVAIVTAAPHRADAYAASRYLIEETKRRAPIWKKERFASGQARWVDGQRGGG